MSRSEPLTRFGTDRRYQDANVHGRLADVDGPATPVGPFAEDDGAIPLANPVSLSSGAIVVAARIGDGPHGTAGDGTGDFDFYAITDATAGQLLTVDIDATAVGSEIDSAAAITDATGAILAFNDDSPELDSFVQLRLPADGDYYVAVATFGSLPTNRFDSGSGTGARTEGKYSVTMSFEFAEDVDVYRVDLRRGDVLGASVTGGARVLTVIDRKGVQATGSGRDHSADYPDSSPLVMPGNASVDHVTGTGGPHYVIVSRGTGELIDAVLATYTENLRTDPRANGRNPRFDGEIRNSRDDADLWGEPNVTRVVIGGTRAQLGFETVGLAPSVDPGNYDREETVVVLLDQLSAPAGFGLATINDFVTPDTDVVGLVGQTLGFIASHETGHAVGNHHTAPSNGVTSIMDTRDLDQLGLGPDLVFGTADDVDVDFVTDSFIEGLVGAEDTLTRVAFGLSSPRRI